MSTRTWRTPFAELVTTEFATLVNVPANKVSLARGLEQEFQTSAEFSLTLLFIAMFNSMINSNGMKLQAFPPTHAPSHGLPLPAKCTKASVAPECKKMCKISSVPYSTIVYRSGIVLGTIFSVLGFFLDLCPVRFPCMLQHFGAGSCHFNCILQHCGVRTSNFP